MYFGKNNDSLIEKLSLTLIARSCRVFLDSSPLLELNYKQETRKRKPNKCLHFHVGCEICGKYLLILLLAPLYYSSLASLNKS